MSFPLLRALFGGVMLLFGRRLFWLFAGLVGFLFGVQVAVAWAGNWPLWLQILAAIGLGVLMALLAQASLRIAGLVVGFVAGALLVSAALNSLDFVGGWSATALTILGGVIGAILAASIFDLAIILLSALAGASAVVAGVQQLFGQPPGAWMLLLGAILAAVGIAYQLRDTQRDD